MTVATAPTPSVEAILHAMLPYRYVDHTHANAVITVTNSPHGEARIREIYGDTVVVIPYVMPGFDLARLCAELFVKQQNANTVGMVLLKHGIFSFGDDARESYERMIQLVAKAEAYLKSQNAWALSIPPASPALQIDTRALAWLRHEVSSAAGKPMILTAHDDTRSLAFVARPDLGVVSQQGPATPDHVIRTKRVPQLGRDVSAYVENYKKYFNEYAPGAKDKKTILDAAPRIILDGEFGVCTAGATAKEAAIVFDIYEHTMDIVERATRLGAYEALPAKDIFDVEYWDLEQAKLRSAGKAPVFAGEVALVTGGACGIGKACVESFLQRGAAVVALDLNEVVTALHARADFLGIVCDLTDETALAKALTQAVKRFGGIDMAVLNAGIFPPGKKIAELSSMEWNKVMAINLDSNLVLLRELHPVLKLSPRGGRVAVIGSKNVPAPGPGAAAYSASKAALNQLVRVAALEWGADRIRINSLHPNAVFDTGIWTDAVLAARAKHYGLTVDEYKTNNVLKVEVKAKDVAELAAELCGPLFAKTTAAQVPVDGGNERVI
jgi:rhamnose utilization protein RhaD (predicted bifunctional aldolase and dehydrogenase)/NAD(P)-dependent dehydrogenase (short-subunit alcohol dehydrogenase family)